MARRRPAGVLVLAILNLVGGSFGLVCTGYSGLTLSSELTTLPSPPPPPPPPSAPGAPRPAPPANPMLNLQSQLHTQVPYYHTFRVGEVVYKLLLALLLLASGVGLLLMHRWGWCLALVYAVLSLIHKAISGWFYLGLVYPVYDAVLFQQLGNKPGIGQQMMFALRMGFFASVFPTLVLTAYPLCLLILLLLPFARKAFWGPPEPAREDEEWDFLRGHAETPFPIGDNRDFS
jgi:hypothetical protein